MEKEPRDHCPSSGETIIDRPAPATPMPGIDRQSADRDADIMQLARIFHRHRRFILTIAALGGMMAGITGLLIAPKYTATAQIVVEPQQDGSIGGSAADVSRPTDQSAIDTHVTMLTSPDHIRRVRESLSGYPDSAATADQGPPGRNATDLQPVTAKGIQFVETMNTALSFGELRRRIKIWLGAIADRESEATREFGDLDRGLKVIQERTSRVISVSFTTASPNLSAAVVNRVVQLYVSRQSEQKRAQANQELAALDQRAAALRSEMDRAGEVIKTLLLSQPSAADLGSEEDARLRILEREAAASGQAYAGLLQRQKDIRDQQEIATSEVRVLSLALPPDRPSSVNPILFIFPALVASLIGASLLAVVRERLDQGLRNEHDVTGALGIPCLGLVPRLPRSYADRPSSYLLHKPFTPYTEAIRSAIATLHVAEPHRRPTTILVSSSVPGEGKTTMAVSLCVYAAQLGRRVLLVDFDFRHPSTLRVLYGPSAPQSLNVEASEPEGLIQHLAELNLDYLPMPCGSADPLALFAGKHMHHFLRQLANNYDCVFIDSPPLLGVTETRLLAALVDSVVFVVKWGSTRREVARNAASVLHDAVRLNGGHPIRAAALMTQVNLKRHASYRYGDVGEVFARFKKYYFGTEKV